MTNPSTPRSALRGWLSPVIHLSNNWLSLIGVVLVTTSAILWLFLLPSTVSHKVDNPYFGIAAFLILPGVFLFGLAIIPIGIYIRFRGERRRGSYPTDFPPLNFRNVDFRRLVLFIGVTSFVNIIIAGHATYTAVEYMDSVAFCGKTCHTVMAPEYAAYQNSPHSRVECVDCHIGPGASWFVKSKLSGAWQVFAVTFNTYERPIPTPVKNLRPARDTCEACHWPQKYGGDKLRIVEKFADDEANTMSKTVLLMRIGGGARGPGIHGTHLGPGIVIRYGHTDEARQDIPWVEYTDSNGKSTVYRAESAKPDSQQVAVREMDCMDCHNRPTHVFDLPERAVDHGMSDGLIPRDLPFLKKTGVELLKKNYATREEAAKAIPAALEAFFRERYPEVYRQRRQDIVRSAGGLLDIYNRNVFPQMKVTWGVYPNNIGHTDFPGCFRCHDDAHTSAGGRKVSQDCNSCHQLLAMEEPAPEILTQLGLAPNGGQQ